MLIFSRRYRSSNKSKNPAPVGRGFTLIELLVVLSIMVILTTVLLVRQSKFDSSTLLRSLAYSVALSVRQAQIYGTSVFGTTTSSSGYCNTGTYQNSTCYAQGYGIYFVANTPAQYILFADLNNNGTYTAGEDVKVFSLGNGYALSNICATTGGGSPVQSCISGGVTWLSLSFRRPNPEACITTNLSPGSCAVGAAATYATSSIQVQLTGGDPGSTRSIYINATGQISVGNAGS